MQFKAPRGTRDILPHEAAGWREMEKKFKELCDLYGFGEIRTPMFEQTELFARSVGEDSDIVSKEMYTFTDRGGRQLTLRPENTAAVVRAYLEHGMASLPQPVKLFYFGPMFRYDRPQAGRYRQFHQFGLELFGAAGAAADAEIIALSVAFFRALGIVAQLQLNSVGCPRCRPAYRRQLLAFLEPLAASFCGDCRRRFATNPLRVLDCKEEACRRATAEAPVLAETLCADCSEHFRELQEILKRLQLPFQLNHRLVRGLDYYTRTVFEFTAAGLGAQAAVAGGGRYDLLVEYCGGAPTPAVGAAFGAERMLLAAEADRLTPARAGAVFVAAAGEGLEKEALYLAQQLRLEGIPAEAEMMGRSLKGQMKLAGRKGCSQVVIIGEREMEQGVYTLKDMAGGEQEELTLDRLLERLRHLKLNKWQ